jgi:hypothetical protein
MYKNIKQIFFSSLALTELLMQKIKAQAKDYGSDLHNIICLHVQRQHTNPYAKM